MKTAFTAEGWLAAAVHVLAAMVLILSAMVPYSLLAARYVPPFLNLGLVGILFVGAAAASYPMARRLNRWLWAQVNR